jgi:hypothetical protein
LAVWYSSPRTTDETGEKEKTMPQAKRILSIEVKRMNEESPDVSFIGEFSSHPDTQFAIDRHERGANCHRTRQWFNPSTVEPFKEDASWIPADVENKRQYWHDAMTKNAEMDYERATAYNDGDFGFIGIRAQAEIVIGGVCQTITSGGLWGIESDSEESYIKSVEQDELADLRGILHNLGFSKRAIATAIKDAD